MKIIGFFVLFYLITFNIEAKNIENFFFADSTDSSVHSLRAFKVMSNGDIWCCMNEYDSNKILHFNLIILDSFGNFKLRDFKLTMFKSIDFQEYETYRYFQEINFNTVKLIGYYRSKILVGVDSLFVVGVKIGIIHIDQSYLIDDIKKFPVDTLPINSSSWSINYAPYNDTNSVFTFEMQNYKNNKQCTHIVKLNKFISQMYKASFDTSLVEKFGPPMVYEKDGYLYYYFRNIFSGELFNCYKFSSDLSSFNSFIHYGSISGLNYPSFRFVESDKDSMLLFGVSTNFDKDSNWIVGYGFLKMKDSVGRNLPILKPFNSKDYGKKIIYPNGFEDMAKSSKENRIYTGGTENLLSYDDTLFISFFASDTQGNTICERSIAMHYPYFTFENEFVEPIPSGGVLFAGNLLPLGGKRTAAFFKMDKDCNLKSVFAHRNWGTDITALFTNPLHFRIIPNPSAEQIEIQFEKNESREIEIVIEDMEGKICTRLKCFAYSSLIDISSLSEGIYTVTLVEQNKVKGVERLVIAK